WRVVRRPQILWLLIILLLYLPFFWFNSISRAMIDVGDPDGINFMDIARNIVSGRGIVQSTGGYSDPHFLTNADDLPSPLTTQPPLYPLLLALVAKTGVPYLDASLLISVISYGLIVLIAYLLVAQLYGQNAGLLAAALVCTFGPLRSSARAPMSECLAVMFT